ncbi:hypothetical protein HOLleu_04234 [Holothuria leucospilota]|uniref:BESS domain-containing protein n=1 Tax=Holothuria leucospilota TaxID=206669 RepID=A0A9Q1CT02_HOLLE|nr:hypothetical protein HOLleu_04234 [Holothuria leucospilota]
MKKYKYAGILEFLVPHLQQRATSSNWTSDSYTGNSSMGPPSDSEVSTYEEEYEGGDDAEQELTLASSETRREFTVSDLCAGKSSSGPQKKKTRMDLSYEVEKSILQFLSNKKSPKAPPSSSATKEDEIDHFCRSMATTLRRLTSKSRAEIQFEIHRLVHHVEMEALYAPTPVHGSNMMTTSGTTQKTGSEQHSRGDMQTAIDLTMDQKHFFLLSAKFV